MTNTMTYATPKGLKAIDKNVASITTNATKLNGLIHATAMGVLLHAREHGDCTRALSLVKAMPASMRRTMLIAWFAAYSPITVKLGDDPKVGINKGKNANAFDADAGDAMPFWQMSEDTPEAAPLDLAKMLKLVEGLAKRIEKRLEAADADTLDAAFIAKATGIATGLRAIN